MKQTTRTDLYPISAAAFWSQICLDLTFQRSMYIQCLGCESMEVLRNEGDVTHGLERTLRFRKPISAPAAIRRIFGDAVTMEERGRYDPHTQSYHFAFTPAMLAERMRIRGSIRTKPAGQGVEVTTETEFRCSVPGVGPLIERVAVANAAESTEAKARFTHAFLASEFSQNSPKGPQNRKPGEEG